MEGKIDVSPISGKGLFAVAKIMKGKLVQKYSGVTVKNPEKSKSDYLTTINDENGVVRTIDGDTYDNIAKYINHSWDPNTKMFDDGSIHAINKIRKSHEITSDYGPNYWINKLSGMNIDVFAEKKGLQEWVIVLWAHIVINDEDIHLSEYHKKVFRAWHNKKDFLSPIECKKENDFDYSLLFNRVEKIPKKNLISKDFRPMVLLHAFTLLLGQNTLGDYLTGIQKKNIYQTWKKMIPKKFKDTTNLELYADFALFFKIPPTLFLRLDFDPEITETTRPEDWKGEYEQHWTCFQDAQVKLFSELKVTCFFIVFVNVFAYEPKIGDFKTDSPVPTEEHILQVLLEDNKYVIYDEGVRASSIEEVDMNWLVVRRLKFIQTKLSALLNVLVEFNDGIGLQPGKTGDFQVCGPALALRVFLNTIPDRNKVLLTIFNLKHDQIVPNFHDDENDKQLLENMIKFWHEFSTCCEKKINKKLTMFEKFTSGTFGNRFLCEICGTSSTLEGDDLLVCDGKYGVLQNTFCSQSIHRSCHQSHKPSAFSNYRPWQFNISYVKNSYDRLKFSISDGTNNYCFCCHDILKLKTGGHHFEIPMFPSIPQDETMATFVNEFFLPNMLCTNRNDTQKVNDTTTYIIGLVKNICVSMFLNTRTPTAFLPHMILSNQDQRVHRQKSQYSTCLGSSYMGNFIRSKSEAETEMFAAFVSVLEPPWIPYDYTGLESFGKLRSNIWHMMSVIICKKSKTVFVLEPTKKKSIHVEKLHDYFEDKNSVFFQVIPKKYTVVCLFGVRDDEKGGDCSVLTFHNTLHLLAMSEKSRTLLKKNVCKKNMGKRITLVVLLCMKKKSVNPSFVFVTHKYT